MANNQLLASDNFASGSLAAGWAAITGLSTCKVVGSGASAVAEPNSNSTSAGQIWTGLAWPADQVSEVTLGAGWTAPSIFQLQTRTASGAYSGYVASINGLTAPTATATFFKLAAGVATQLGSPATGLTVAAGDIWSFQMYGPCMVLYQNAKVVLYWCDTTYTSGSPGFLLNSAVLAHAQVSSWRGYNAIQQDGIWNKLGAANIPVVSSDINTGVSFVNSGLDSASIVLHEGNAQILSGTVYKMWFGTASGIQYAESLDGLTWSRHNGTVLAGFSFPQIFKSGSTYYLYVQSNTVAAGTANIAVYTSTDGITWSLQNSNVIALGAGGTWDATAIYLFSPVYIDGGGVWHALYSGVKADNTFALGLATSSDGITWTKYGSNPVASSIWASVPYLINGVWWLWGAGVPPGQASAQNPTVGIRTSSTDLITWATPVPSIQHSQLAEGVNGVIGFAYPTALFNVGNQTYQYFEAGPSNTASNTGTSWNLSLATAPARMSSLILFPENAIQQVASDTFTNTPPNLSANWTTPSWGSAAKIIAGPLVEPTATSTICAALYTGASFGNDQYSAVALQTLSATGIVIISVRGSASVRTQYEAVLVGSTGSLQTTKSYISRVVSGAVVQLTPFAECTLQPHDVLTLGVVGNVLSLYQNGFLILQCEDIDNSITSGIPGFWLYNSAAIAQTQIVAWSGGNANVLPSFPSGGTPLAGGDSADDEEDDF